MEKRNNKSVALMFRRNFLTMILLIILMSIPTFMLLAIGTKNYYGDPENKLFLYIATAVLILTLIVFAYLLISIHDKLPKSMEEDSKIAQSGAAVIMPSMVQKSRETNATVAENEDVFNKFNGLILLIENMNKNVSFKEVLDYIYKSFWEFIPYTYIGIALIGEDGKTVRASYGVTSKYHMNLPKRLLGYKTDIENTSLGRILDSGKERIINDLEEYLADKPKKDYNAVLIEEGIRASITFPLKNNGRNVGIIFFSSNKKNIYKKEHVEFLRTIANSITLCLEKSIFFDDMIIGSIQALARLAEQRDSETGEHIFRMKTYSRVIAELLYEEEKYRNVINVDYINSIERLSPLHDIGKVGIRDDILLKPGKLTRDEFEIMKFHTVYGGWVLKDAEDTVKKWGRSIFKIGIEIAECHHEKWDGTGYPNGLMANEIPLSARIVAAADVFDALTSKRIYKEAYPFEESLNIIIEGSGKHFDPNISEIFKKHSSSIREVYDEFKNSQIL
ncbi:cyclic di-GMP phosphodiesterase response regulator RpfG [Oxobacter pfennigii]|uniref:Cyclic di-GMP phosphodiesterase response regulator RpfG n=1 Tax=Oxobacter pfennigii TaxID=36849 RepID=A0A0P8Y7W1_9CLOT|nr:HD domain-containing phosphohydrolase [Oxobacter pfennigii]KPU42667.1 cyclic di-GMP phosphodiesterase response regulator RpfG [Oxobacter pfennigii]